MTRIQTPLNIKTGKRFFSNENHLLFPYLLLVNTAMLPCSPAPSPLPAVTLTHPHASLLTTIKLGKNHFSAATDRLAEKARQPWQPWAQVALADKPAGTGAASWLRVKALQQSIQGDRHG